MFAKKIVSFRHNSRTFGTGTGTGTIPRKRLQGWIYRKEYKEGNGFQKDVFSIDNLDEVKMYRGMEDKIRYLIKYNPFKLDIKEIETDFYSYGSDVFIVEKIDHALYRLNKHKNRDNDNSVNINLKCDETYPANIKPHIRYLDYSVEWDERMVRIFCRIWNKLIQNKKIYCEDFIRQVMSYEKPNWIYSNEFLSCPHYILWDDLKRWSDHCGHRYSFLPIIKLLETVMTYKIKDNSAINLILLEDRKILIERVKEKSRRLSKRYSYIIDGRLDDNLRWLYDNGFDSKDLPEI